VRPHSAFCPRIDRSVAAIHRLWPLTDVTAGARHVGIEGEGELDYVLSTAGFDPIADAAHARHIAESVWRSMLKTVVAGS